MSFQNVNVGRTGSDLHPRDPDGVADIVWGWSFREIYPWISRSLDKSILFEGMLELNQTSRSVFVFRICNGTVSILEKPDIFRDGPIDRAEFYRKFIQDSVSAFCGSLETTIALYLEDGALNLDDIPIFAFQKPEGFSDLLLPDPDFLREDFYALNPAFSDKFAYEDKSCTAVFAGSTSGGFVTREAIRNGTHPRLKSAIFFKDNPLVDFRIPVIVQYDSSDTLEFLKEMGFGGGNWISWHDQFRHKFVISVDGNGATCSRIPVILSSNSVLFKYNSIHNLYYFDSMRPWLHYVPIFSDLDVLAAIEKERANPGLFKFIAEEGKRFAATYLTRYQAMRYTAFLLLMYSAVVDGGPRDWDKFKTAALAAAEIEEISGSVLAHIQGRGDTWFGVDAWIGEPGSGRALEGFAIDLQGGISPSDLTYHALLDNGTASRWCRLGEFCGTRGENRGLTGLRLALSGRIAERYQCAYSALFIDGARIGPIPDGEICRSPAGAPLEAFRLEIMARKGGE